MQWDTSEQLCSAGEYTGQGGMEGGMVVVVGVIVTVKETVVTKSIVVQSC